MIRNELFNDMCENLLMIVNQVHILSVLVLFRGGPAGWPAIT
jgi:hypothetical protein